MNEIKTEEIKVKQLKLLKKAQDRQEMLKLQAGKKIAKLQAKLKKKPLKKLKQELKRITHAIVRNNYDTCYSCGKYVPPELRTAGHFFTDGGHGGTRYDFDNLRTQHQICNYHRGGDAEYADRLLSELGVERFHDLARRAKERCMYTREDFERLIEERKNILMLQKKAE
jgi:hypothetical protein